MKLNLRSLKLIAFTIGSLTICSSLVIARESVTAAQDGASVVANKKINTGSAQSSLPKTRQSVIDSQNAYNRSRLPSHSGKRTFPSKSFYKPSSGSELIALKFKEQILQQRFKNVNNWEPVGAKNNSKQLKLSQVPKHKRPLKRVKRQTPCQQGEELDDYVDQLFRFGTRIVRAMEPITLPNVTVELPDYNMKIFLYEGKGTRAYKFKRAKSAWVFCSNETISLGLTIEVEELHVAYKYRVISGTRLIFDGDLEAKLSPRVQAQFSQAVQAEDSEEPVQQRVDRLRIFRLGKVHVLIRGLGNLTSSISMLINSYLNDNQEELQPTFRTFEGDAVRMINKMLANVNVPLLSVV